MRFIVCHHWTFVFFFFNDTATTEIYTLSLHDALPISGLHNRLRRPGARRLGGGRRDGGGHRPHDGRRVRQEHRSEEHTSELQSRQYLVCRLLLEKKKCHSGGGYTSPPLLRSAEAVAFR